MSVPTAVKKYLDKKGVKYELVPHKKVFTAYDLAQTLGESLEKVAKTLLISVELPEIKSRGKYYIVAIPASYRLSPEKIKKALKARKVGIAPERVMKKLGIEPGAVSPFATLHQLELLLDKTLLQSKKALMRAGSLTESIRMSTKDLYKIENALAGIFGAKAVKVKTARKKKVAKRKAKPRKKKRTISGKRKAIKRRPAKRKKPAKKSKRKVSKAKIKKRTSAKRKKRR